MSCGLYYLHARFLYVHACACVFTLALKHLGREQECFGRIELRGKTLPVPRTNIIACLLVCVISIVSDVLYLHTCGQLQDVSLGVSTLVLHLPNWKAVHVNILFNEIGVYPPTHKRNRFVQPKCSSLRMTPKCIIIPQISTSLLTVY